MASPLDKPVVDCTSSPDKPVVVDCYNIADGDEQMCVDLLTNRRCLDSPPDRRRHHNRQIK